MSAPIFSEPADSPPPVSPLLDGRSDFNVVFIHSRLDDYGLSPQQFRVYAHLARRASSGEAFPAVKTIASVCQLHPQTVREALRILVNHRLITRSPRPGRTPIYRLTPAAHWQPPTRITGNPSESNTPPSISEDTPTKRMESHPYETDGAEGNPFEGNPTKAETHIPPAAGLPRSEAEAIEAAAIAGVPPDFARNEFNRLEAVGWLNGAGNPVRKFIPQLRKRWTEEQSQRAERQAIAAARSVPARNSATNGESPAARHFRLTKEIDQLQYEIRADHQNNFECSEKQKQLRKLKMELEKNGRPAAPAVESGRI